MIKRNTAEQHAPTGSALLPGLFFLILALALCGTALFRHSLPIYLRPLFFQLSLVLFLASAGFLTTFLTIRARKRGPFTRTAAVNRLKRSLPRPLEEAHRRYLNAVTAMKGVDWQGDWLPLVVAVLLSAASLFAAYKGWRRDGVLIPPTHVEPWIAGILVALAFPMLVLERRFSALSAAHTADDRPLTYLVRLILFMILGLAFTAALRWLGLPFATVIEHVTVIFCALVAAELVLRGASYVFMPLPPLSVRRSHATSLFASLLRWQRPSLKAMRASVSSQFGIDLGRSWALGFIRRATFPVLIGMALTAWLLTGVTALDLSQRAVYEAFGNPQGVFHSGIHAYLPWPFGRLKPVEYGVVREIAVAFPDEDDDAPAKISKVISAKPTIEGQPPENADRLWEASRPTEDTYLSASSQNGNQNFEVLNVDLRIIYRIGLSDQAALSAAYSLDKPEDLIRAAAGRMLARYFARYTTESVLGQNRDAFVRGFQKELQARLNTLSPSIDILGVVIGTIHPPAGAAEAYQEVQASSIEAITKIANAQGDAVRDVHQAQADATEARDGATAQAAETVADAKVGTALFAGDAQAYAAGGQSFLFERRLSVLQKAITPDTHLLIVDHRIPASQMQLLGMRTPGAPPPGSAGN